MKHFKLMSLAAGMLLSLSALPLSAAFAVEEGFGMFHFNPFVV